MNLPESSMKVINYHWPVVEAFTYLKVAEELHDEAVKAIMKDYLANKNFLVREQKALMQRIEALLENVA